MLSNQGNTGGLKVELYWVQKDKRVGQAYRVTTGGAMDFANNAVDKLFQEGKVEHDAVIKAVVYNRVGAKNWKVIHTSTRLIDTLYNH